jgi:hypothetical protein
MPGESEHSSSKNKGPKNMQLNEILMATVREDFIVVLVIQRTAFEL